MTKLLRFLIAAVTSCRSILALSVGQAIQSVSNAEDGLKVAADLWLPSDKHLPAHYGQAVHHETRQRWASQLLEKLFTSNDCSLNFHDSRLDRAIQASAIPHDSTVDRSNKEGSWILTSLQSIHGMVSRKMGLLRVNMDPECQFLPETLHAIERLIERACALADQFSLDQACQLVWSIQGLYARLPELEKAESFDQLKNRVSEVPFEIVPRGLDWLEISEAPDLCSELIHAIPFSKDTIITRRGEAVKERRGTAWIAADGIGNLAYSGKLMSPKSIPPTVCKVMRCVEESLDLGESFFDCALCNHYADATSACKFHTDPEHGLVWHRITVVVAAGSDRKFAFKPISTTWQDWDPLQVPTNHQAAASIHLFSGDLVVMKENCNDEFYHAVHAGDSDEDRVSLVLKKALDRNGKKGHGQQGQGRRARRKMNEDSQSRRGGQGTRSGEKRKRRQRTNN